MRLPSGKVIATAALPGAFVSKDVDPADSDALLVERTVRIARELSLEPATPDEAKSIPGVVKKH